MWRKLDQDTGKAKIAIDRAISRALDLREDEKYIANSRWRAPVLARHDIRSCLSCAFQSSSFDLIRLSQREAAHRRTRKLSRTGVHGGPSLSSVGPLLFC